jgi:hypothetical protein
MELDLDGAPRNPKTDAPSSFAARWRVGETEVVADRDAGGHVVHIRVDGRAVGGLPPSSSRHVFTIETQSGLRGGAPVEARIQRDLRTGVLTLWIEGIEVPAFVRPPPPIAARPGSPAAAPLRIEPLTLPSRGKVRLIVFGTLLALFLALFFIPKLLLDRPK